MGKYEKQKGYNFEVDVAKTICRHFGLDRWQKWLPRTRTGRVYHSKEQSAGQLLGDLHPTKEMVELTGFTYAIECKARKGWTLSAILKHFRTTKVYKWWLEAKEEIDPSFQFLLIFTQPHAPTFVLYARPHAVIRSTAARSWISLEVPSPEGPEYPPEQFGMELLATYLESRFPRTDQQRPVADDEEEAVVVPPKKARKVRKVAKHGPGYQEAPEG